MYRISESLLSQLSSRVAARFRGAAGDRTQVGLFIRVPEHLAEMFPPAPPEDTSPRHVTLLYVGEVPAEYEDLFLEVVRGVLEGWGPVDAAFDGLDYFVHPEKDRRVYYTRVKFDRDLGSLRDRISHMLGEFGFEVDNSHPLAFNPHATLDYVDGLYSEYTGPVPTGGWVVDEIEVWGLPREHAIFLGDRNLVNTRLAEFNQESIAVPMDLWEDMIAPVAAYVEAASKEESAKKDHVASIRDMGGNLLDATTYYGLLEPDPSAVDRGLSWEMSAGLDPDMAWDIVHDNLAADPNYYR